MVKVGWEEVDGGRRGLFTIPANVKVLDKGESDGGLFLSLASLAERSASCFRIRLVELMLTVDAVSGFVDDVFPLL